MYTVVRACGCSEELDYVPTKGMIQVLQATECDDCLDKEAARFSAYEPSRSKKVDTKSYLANLDHDHPLKYLQAHM
jgi:hypothetical protein